MIPRLLSEAETLVVEIRDAYRQLCTLAPNSPSRGELERRIRALAARHWWITSGVALSASPASTDTTQPQERAA